MEHIGLQAAVYEILADAIDQDINRRGNRREPLLTSVLIQPDEESDRWLTGLTRDVSPEGIGLIHFFPLECGECVIKVTYPNRKPKLLKIKIQWCRPFGDGWYISGGLFIARLDG